MPPPIAAIFVSSTWLDLQPERAAVEQALNRFYEAKFIGMEYFGSRDETTRRASLDEVDRSQLYIGIFAARYGSGITEAEYRRARERQIDCLIYFKADDAIAAEMREADTGGMQRLAALKEELRRHTVTTFSTAEELAAECTADVHRWLFDKFLKKRLQQDAVGEIFTSKTGEVGVTGAQAYRLQVGSSLGSVLYTAAAPVPQRRPTPLLPNVRRFRGLIDRTDELQSALDTLPTALPVEIHGPAGAGKTVLLRTIAYHPNLTGNPDGVVYLDRVGTQPLADLQQCLVDSFYESAPRLKPREGELRQLLREPRALILLDDVEQSSQEIESVFNLLPNSLFCLAAEERRLYGEVKTIALAGLNERDAQALLERELGAPLSEQDRAAAGRIIALVEGKPSELILASATAHQENKSLGDLVKTGEPEPPSGPPLRRSIAARSAGERRLLAVLAALGTVISKEALAASIASPAIEPLIEGLLDAKLIQTDGTVVSLTYGVASAVEAFADLAATRLEVLPHLLGWAERHRSNSELLLRDSSVLEQAATSAAEGARWSEVLRLARAVEPAYSSSGRWDAWQKMLELAERGATELRDTASRAWALHQLGSRAICLGDFEPGKNILQQALALRIDLGDHWGAAITRHNLDLLRPPVLPGGVAEQLPAELDGKPPTFRSKLAGIPSVLKLAGLGIVALATGLIAQTLWRQPVVPFELAFSPPSLEFVSPALNQPSPPQILSVTNPGNAPLTIRTAGLRDPSGGDFTVIENQCEAKLLSAGSACSVRLRYTPSSTEPSTARLIFSESGGDRTAIIELRGGIESLPGPTTSPVLSVRPESVEFGDREIGSRARAEITVVNSGNAPLLLGQSSIAGSAAEDLAVARNACANRPIAPQAECAIEINFTPRAEGVRDAALVLTASDGAREQIALRGAGISRPMGAISAEPAEVGFGEVDLRRRAEGQINLVHGGAAAVEIGRIAIRGRQASDFSITANGCQGITLAAGRRCRLIVSFAPGEPGRREATLIIADNTPTGERRIPLTGFGRAPAVARLEFDPEFLDFGERAANAPPLSRRLIVRNSGTVDVRMFRAAIFGADARHFSLASNSCSGTLAREQSCRMTARYRPTAAGGHEVVLRIEFDGGQREIALRGHATAEQTPIASIRPTRLDFGDQTLRSRGRSQEVNVQNRGGGELVITGVAIKGSNSFTIVNGCTRPLGERGSCTLRVNFLPRTRGRQIGDLFITHNAAKSPQRIELSGVGTLSGTPNIDVAPERLLFGNQSVGTPSGAQSVTVTSTGSAPLAIRAIAIQGEEAGDFTMSDSCANRKIAPRGRCHISVRFAPKAQAPARTSSISRRSATLIIHHNGSASPQRISVNGTALIKPTGSVFPGALKVDPDIRILESGWCCTNGSVQRSTPAQCAEKNGSFFADQQSATSRCIPVIR